MNWRLLNAKSEQELKDELINPLVIFFRSGMAIAPERNLFLFASGTRDGTEIYQVFESGHFRRIF